MMSTSSKLLNESIALNNAYLNPDKKPSELWHPEGNESKSTISTCSSNSSSSSTITKPSSSIDLRNASIEDLEGLIAASAKRLASYRIVNQHSTSTEERSRINRWKAILSNEDITPIKQPLEESKGPSESYLRIRNMFESPQEMVPIKPTPSVDEKIKAKKLKSIPHPFLVAQKQEDQNKSNSKPEEDSALQSKKLSTLATLQQHHQSHLAAKANPSKVRHEVDTKSIEEYINSVKKSTSSPRYRQSISSSIHSSKSTLKTPLPSSNSVKKPLKGTAVKQNNFSSTEATKKTKKEKTVKEKPNVTPLPPLKPTTPKNTRPKVKTPSNLSSTSGNGTAKPTTRKSLSQSNPPTEKRTSRKPITRPPLPTPKRPDPKRSKTTPTLQERLQGLVDESQNWTSQLLEREKPHQPITPEVALERYEFSLTSFERQEILQYEHVYYVGQHAKKRPASPSQASCNYGYDDERGDYLVQLKDHLDFRYEVMEVMGKGSFGQVLKCIDHQTGQTVAIKMIRNKKRFHAQALVEVKILEDLLIWDPEDKHHNVRMLGHFIFRSHLCITFECLSINLYEFIKRNSFQGFSMGLIRRFSAQLLNSLSLLHKHKLIHCDLKPENILLKNPAKSTIKIIDFGSSCLENEKLYTYIQSRFYRSPEVILGMPYSVSIDMWSVGCILSELYTGYPLFPGENEQEQLACIMEIQGIPHRDLIEKSTRRKLFFDTEGRPYVKPNSKGRIRKHNSKTLEQVLKTTDESFLDFIRQCLCLDPDKRLKPDDALKHPWMVKSRSKKV